MPRHNPNGPPSPSPEMIVHRRREVGLTQTEAAALVYVTLTGWQKWEQGDARMHPAFWELFLAKTHEEW